MAIVLFLFLGEFRSAVVVIVALPLAMIIAFILMQQFGLSANLMSLAGLAIGIGMMVDGAVVMVENAYRVLSEHAGRRVDRLDLVHRAALEVANPIGFAILIIIVVFLPLLTLTCLEGKLFKPMAYTISFAMAGSLLLSLTLVPVLCSLVLRAKTERETWLLRTIKRRYTPLLDWSLEHKKPMIGGALVLLLASLALFPFMGKEFMPNLQEGEIMFRATSIPSTSLEESVRVSQQMNEVLRKNYPQTTSVVATIGRAEKGETTDANYMEVLVAVGPESDWPQKMSMPELSARMQETLEEAIPTVVFSATQPIQMRVEELISGVRATLALKVYGTDLAELDRLGQALKPVLAGVAGVADLSLEANVGKSQLILKVNRAAFNSLRHATLIIANVPFAIIGGIVALAATGQYISVPSAIGFIAVFGVAMLNGIVLVSFMNEQLNRGKSVREAVREGTLLRLRPVLMTASVAILGLLPMLLSQGVGAETQQPLATVVIGGLITSTVLTLLLLPMLYEWIERRRETRTASELAQPRGTL